MKKKMPAGRSPGGEKSSSRKVKKKGEWEKREKTGVNKTPLLGTKPAWGVLKKGNTT